MYCEEALERLCNHHALTAEEEKNLLSNLPFKKQCTTEEEERMLQILYQAKLRHNKKIDPRVVCLRDTKLKQFADNTDVILSTARKMFHGKNVHACYKLTTEELQKDPFHPGILQLHILCCVEKKKQAELFSLGHKLVGNFPSLPLAWFAVSCYYLTIQSHQNARKYLTKVLSLDQNFAPAHIAFGLSFATEGEHDQAISAFSTAARTMKGSHIPLMQLGREYYITGSTTTAIRFMKNALAISPDDPTLLQEVGVMLVNAGNYDKAVKYFLQALACLRVIDRHMTIRDWEPVYNNLAHVYRKQNKYDLSLEMHHRALSLSPKEPSTLTAIAFVHLLRGEYDNTIEYCSRSLQIRREDPFTIELLKTASDELVSSPLVLEPGPDRQNYSLDALEPENEILEWGQQNGTKTATIGEKMQTD